MDRSYEEKRRGLEEDYWLFKARRELIYSLVTKDGVAPDTKVLDVGCGGGYLIDFFQGRGFKKIFGLDISRRSIETCKQRGLKKVWMDDGGTIAAPDGSFDVILAVDVLEHIADDSMALKEWGRVLKNGGSIFLTIPAFSFLWSRHDEICHHFRRYSKATVLKILNKSGFVVEEIGFWNFMLFFPASILRLSRFFAIDRGDRKGDQLYKVNSIINTILLSLLRFENSLGRMVHYPVGLSLFAVVRKSDRAEP